MSLAATATDQPKEKSKVVEHLLKYVHTDGACIRYEPGKLEQRQAATFDPLLLWARQRLGWTLTTSHSIFGTQQDEATVAAVEAWLQGLSRWHLAAAEQLITASKSVVIAAALLYGRINVAQAVAAARIEEEYQLEDWGMVEAGHDLDIADTRSRLGAPAVFTRLLALPRVKVQSPQMAWHMCALVLLLTSTVSLVSATLAADSLVTIPVHNVAASSVGASPHSVGAAALAATDAAAIPQDTRVKLVAAGSAGSRKGRSLLHQPDDNAYFLTVDRIRKLYNLPTDAFDGEGEAIALASFEKFEIGTVEEYALANGLIEEGESLSNVIERFLSDPDSVGGSSNPDATHVDLEMLLSASPKAKITVYLAENSEAGEALLMSKIANLNTSSIVLYTWGREEQPGDADGTINTLLKQMVLQGQSVVVASGSCGVRPQTRNATCDELTEAVNFPASSEFVTAVGGTTPTLFIGNTWAKEVAWELSSGGVSRYMPLPQYQADVTTLVNRQHRNLPDVALAANPDVWPYEVYVPNEANEFSTVGGTAPAASVWAGYFALINQCRKARELAPARLGAANGQLYAIGNTKWQADKAFRSCSEGSNGKFDAGAGWDAVTGWNSMNGKLMTGFLCPGYMGACCYRTKYGNSYCVELTEENCDASKGGTFTDGKVCTPGTPMTLSNC
ncbi:hypothetical protein OEZ85_014180 [Tetradesmus obliquus]|uniref:Peptidase S53 domain-containing protein n=1 Tax=Tetradesmus obliquus TaxID=3088 RepID=A0ABY8U7X2_TETOB|nr:hypothetical protein OEZ85_014180 [Tetradesmus obliquus]